MKLSFYKICKLFCKGFLLLLLCCASISATANKKELKGKFNLHSVNFVQNSIDVSKSDETLYFSLRAYSLQGLSRVDVYFESPSGNELIQTTCSNKKKTKVGMLLGRILFKKKSESGEWKINKIVVVDLEGNSHTYDKEFLAENKFTHSLMIKSKR
ncbi:hypothetical protein [Marinifilum caeruleilacunae]|uniref:Uncharacterized protein n=1 Tax=Marinifilum caeruleilacunae TaxID=2499076 RepID=A0ABX1WQM9_9BACT|nr:hypothetical protein [Marinifilum caeruleilacunae]NOU58249.1 hypothetical protein [Marinifilum caeruleilacunae]